MCGKGTLRTIVRCRYDRLAAASQHVAWATMYQGPIPAGSMGNILDYLEDMLQDSRQAYGQALRTYERLLRKEETS